MNIQDIIEKYPEAPIIVAMAESAWAGSRTTEKIEFALSDRLKIKLKERRKKKIKKTFIPDSDARQIKKQHGQNEEQRGQENITPADFALIPVVLNEYDTVENTGQDKKGNIKLLFSKKMNGIVYSASIERGNNQIGVITLWKVKK
jgi:hypothetical protein